MNKKIIKPNKLINETSEYLKLHITSPINWYPWGEEAFEESYKSNKLIFLSIGTLNDYWCSLMDNECFNNNEVIDFLNEHFICIKVDKDQKPDIAKLYMDICELITGKRAYPLTFILTPEKLPFFAGNYIPLDNKDGYLGLLGLLKRIQYLWTVDKETILKNSKDFSKSFHYISTYLEREIDDLILDNLFEQINSTFDIDRGGFDKLVKFLRPNYLLILLRYYKRAKHNDILNMVLKTLDNMLEGDIYDKVNYGFYHYANSTDWNKPCEQKLLYDQALMLLVLIYVYQITNNKRYYEAIINVINYVLKYLQSNEGAFYLSEDKKTIFTNLNSLMSGILANCGFILNEPYYLQIAKKNLDFIFKNLVSEDKLLLHTFTSIGNLEDYTFLIYALIEMYQATFDISYLHKAIKLNNYILENYFDDTEGGFYFSPFDKNKIAQDSNIPSVNSMGFYNLIRLSKILNNKDLEDKAFKLVRNFAKEVNKAPLNYTFFINFYDFYIAPCYKVVIVGDKLDCNKFLDFFRKNFILNKVIVLVEPNSNSEIFNIFNLEMIENKPTVYIYDDYGLIYKSNNNLDPLK